MRTRRLITFLLGAWLAGSLFMAFVATQNFRMVERFLDNQAHPGVRQLVTLGQNDAFTDLRSFVAESNRFYFEYWEWTQILLTISIAALLWLSPHGSKALIVLSTTAAALAIVQRTI